MSFESLSKPELVAAAEKFGVESDGTKAAIIERLVAEGVDWELYETVTENSEKVSSAAAPQKPAARVEPTGEEAVIQFLGKGSYASTAFVVSAGSPFAVVDSAVAEALASNRPEKFRIATADELADFYA